MLFYAGVIGLIMVPMYLIVTINCRDIRETIGIGDTSTTKRNGDSEQEAIEQINTHTKLDILQRNGLIRI